MSVGSDLCSSGRKSAATAAEGEDCHGFDQAPLSAFRLILMCICVGVGVCMCG